MAPVTEHAGKRNKRTANKVAQEVIIIIERELPEVGGNEDEKLEPLYEQIAWPLGKKYGHPYDTLHIRDSISSLMPHPPDSLYLENLTGSSPR